MSYNKLELTEKTQTCRFAVSIAIRDPFGNIRGYKFFQTNSSDSLADWYARNSTNELDFPSVGVRKRKEANKRYKNKKKNNNPKSKLVSTENKTTTKG